MTSVIASKATATLGGFPLILDSGPARWSLREGVHPSIGEFEMAPDDARSVLGIRGPLKLTITDATGGSRVTVENLWCLNIMPGAHPWISTVVVADRRWFWPYALVRRVFNKRRNIGIKRVLANDEFAADFDRAFDVGWWRWSLDNGRRYTALRVLQKVLEDVNAAEKSAGGSSFPITVEDSIGTKIKGLPIEDLEITDPGDLAVQRALEALPEAGITVDYDGTVLVYSKASGKEKEIVKALMPEIRDMGHTDLVTNANIRPSKVNVYFVPEVEVRFDFIETAQVRRMTVTEDEPLGEGRRMQNVLPIPDYELTVNGRTLPQGSWISVDDAFRAWGDMPLLGVDRALDHDLVQRAMIPHMELYEALQISGNRPDNSGVLRNWTDRLSTLFTHYRTTFQLNRRWLDRFYSWRAYRLATVNPQTGQRGPSRAYGDYCILYTQRSLWRNRRQGKPMDFAINRSAYPADGKIGPNAAFSPAVVEIVDHDQGVFHVDYRGKNPLTGDTRTILPSQIALDGMPSVDAWSERPISFDTVVERTTPPRLSSEFKMAVIFTAIPASPNDKRCLYKVTVTPDQVRDLLPSGAHAGLCECRGPEMDIFVGPNKEVARICWNDDRADDIEKLFGLREGTPNLQGLVLNTGNAGDLEKGGSVDQIAKAEAALIYASLVDRYEGDMTGYLNGNVHLSGWTSEIRHELTPSGEVFTSVAFPVQIPKFNLFSFLDSNSRAAMLKLVQPEA